MISMISANILQSDINLTFTHNNKMWDGFDEMCSRASLAALRNRLQQGWDRGSWGQQTWLLKIVPGKVFNHIPVLGVGSTESETLNCISPVTKGIVLFEAGWQSSFCVTLALMVCKSSQDVPLCAIPHQHGLGAVGSVCKHANSSPAFAQN